MIAVRFYIKGNIVQVDSFDELPSVSTAYDFGGRKHECYKQETLGGTTYNYYLHEKIPAMFEPDYKIYSSSGLVSYV